MTTTNTTDAAANTTATTDAAATTKAARTRKPKQEQPAPAAAPETTTPAQTDAPDAGGEQQEQGAAEAAKPEGHNSNKGKQIQMNTVGPKRELAYATVGLLAVLTSVMDVLAATPAEGEDDPTADELRERIAAKLQSPNVDEARAALTKHGYADLKPRAERIAAIQAKLAVAAAGGDAAEVVKLAKQMKAIQDGRED